MTGEGPGLLAERLEFPTTTSQETIERAISFFRESRYFRDLRAVGIASFGPVDLNRQSATYGYITSTPKAGWQNVDLVGAVGRGAGLPIGFDTDVNAAALAEHRWGAGRGLDDLLYVTVGTGIGGGGLMNGRLMHGLIHPELGHVRIPHNPEEDPFAGNCRYHGDCLEGLASGPAIEARRGAPARDLPWSDTVWRLEARYLALGIVNWICTLSPRKIILGGGVMNRRELFPVIRAEVQRLLAGYIQASEMVENIGAYIVPPELGADAGALGAIALASEVG